MKKITFLLLLVFISQWSISQIYTIDDTDMTPFEDISATGTALGLIDDGEANVTLPFTFEVDGQSSTDVRIGNNGGILFAVTDGNVPFTNATLIPQDPALIAPFWDDIDDNMGDVFWEVLGTAPNRRFIVQWNDRSHFNNIGSSTFQAILFEGSNDVLFVYEDVLFEDAQFDNGASATIGVASINDIAQYSFNTPSLGGVNAIRFTPIIPPAEITCPDDIEVNVDQMTILFRQPDVEITTSFTPAFGTLPESTIDGSGLSELQNVNATHENTAPGNSFVSAEMTGTFDFSFIIMEDAFPINGFVFWNQNNGGPGGAGSTGIQDVIISSSSDGGTTFTPIPGAPSSFAQVMENGPVGPEVIMFDTALSALDIIRIEVLSNYGDANTGFGEIAFLVPLGDFNCDAVVIYDLPVVSGTMNTPTLVDGIASGETFPVGTTTNTFEVMDNEGNIISCSFDVTVIDNIFPTIECPEDLTINAIEGEITIELPDFTVDTTADDNCPDFNVTQDPVAGTVFDAGTVEFVNLTVTDASGNETSCSFEVTLDFSLNTDDFSLDNSISIYPNPANGVITINNTGNILINEAIITDINGRVIQTTSLNTINGITQISLSTLNNGLYFVRINSDTASIVRRIFKN